MKRYLLRILLFFALVGLVDFVIGSTIGYLQSSLAGGRTGAEFHLCKESDEDIIILGSSRASHHYVPRVITDSLGLTCFNGGQDGNGIVLQYGRWKMLSERYVPKILIYDVTPSFDITVNDNMTYIDRLKPFCVNKSVKQYIVSLFPLESIKLFSQMYRYNYKFLEYFADCFKSKDDNHGYIPLNGSIKEEIVNRGKVERENTIIIDTVKLHCFSRLIEECLDNGTQIVFAVSPFYLGGQYDFEAFSSVLDLSVKYNIPFLYFNDTELCSCPELFKDSGHLNCLGAEKYTALVVETIKGLGLLEQQGVSP